MNRTEHQDIFQPIDREKTSYFNDVNNSDMILPYHFSTLPEFRAILKERLHGCLSDSEVLQVAQETFRHKPVPNNKETPSSDSREVVDFIYEM